MDHENETPRTVTAVEDLIRQVPQGTETVFDLTAEGGEKVKRVEVVRRDVQPESPVEPAIARRQARCHTFHEAGAFSAYMKRSGGEGTTLILANVGTRCITAVLDETDADDQEVISLQVKQHPLFTQWAKLLSGGPVPAVEFALFVMQNRRAVVQPEGRELAMVFSQIKMSKSLSIHTGVGKKSINGVVATVEIAGQKQEQPIELPESITINVPLFAGSDPLDIEIDLLVTEFRDQAVVYATSSEVESKQIEAFEQLVEQIREETGQLVGLGEVKHRDWEVVE